MGLINYSKVANQTLSDASQVNTPLDTIYDEFNGNIDGANIKTTANISVATVTTSGDANLGGLSIKNGKLDTDNSVVTSNITDSSVTADKVALGFPVQMAIATYNAADTTTAVMDDDDTAPAKTQGKEFMTISITPKSATNVLVVEASGLFAPSAADTINLALFKDSDTPCFAASGIYQANNNAKFMIPCAGKIVAGGTTEIKFSLRAGLGSASGTLTFNGAGGGRRFGDVIKSFIKVTEYKA